MTLPRDTLINLGLSFIAFSLGLLLTIDYSKPIWEELKTLQPIQIVGSVLAVASSLYAVVSVTSILKARADESFTSIDELILYDEDRLNRRKADPQAPANFETYFREVVGVLEEKAANADHKASLLLDKGRFYVWFGIVFYVGAAVIWQILIHLFGFKPEFLVGMISISIVFFFIEFLSAWFLKQYRHFVDTSTYLLKVKGIFDRFFLMALVAKGSPDEDQMKLRKALMDALSEAILWPSESHVSKPDISFAREMLESVTQLVKASKRGEQKESTTLG